jgi:tetratricopeptide (TPR) repeat protein
MPAPGSGQQEEGAKYAAVVTAAQQAVSRSDFKAAVEDYKQAVTMHPEAAEMWANLGLVEHESGAYAEAIQSFQQALRRKPTLYAPKLFLGIDYLHTGNTRAAIHFLTQAEAANKTDPEAPLELGRAYSSTGNFPAAAREFGRVTELDPKQSDAWLGRGIAYLDQVEEDARKLSTNGRNSSYAQALYAESMTRQSRYIEATDSFEKATASEPQPPCLHAEFGFMYWKQQKMEDAQSEFERELKEDPGCGLAALGQAGLHVEEGSYPEALALLRELWKRDAGFVRAHVSLLAEGLPRAQAAGFVEFLAQENASGKVEADLYQCLTAARSGNAEPFGQRVGQSRPPAGSADKFYSTGRYEQCAATLKENFASRSERELLLLSACAYYSGDYELASDASETLAARPSHSLGGLYWSIKANQRMATEALARFEQLAPDSAQSHILLGDMYRQRQRYDDAQAQYKRALELSPTDHAALLGLAYAYFGNAKIDDTIATATSALAGSPSDPELNLLMGEALLSRRNFAAAEPFLQKGLGAKPQMLPHVHALLGTVYAEMGRTQEAIAQLEMGLSADEDGSTHYKLARMYRKAGDSKRADATMQQVKVLEEQRRQGAVTAIMDSSQPADEDPPQQNP